jgi:hypothetical protein
MTEEGEIGKVIYLADYRVAPEVPEIPDRDTFMAQVTDDFRTMRRKLEEQP